MWQDAAPWPLAPDQKLARFERPLFLDSFGDELDDSLACAQDLLITGVTRNGFIRDRYGKLEAWLNKGCRMRFVIVDPDSDAIATAADRYYAERSAGTARERVLQPLGC